MTNLRLISTLFFVAALALLTNGLPRRLQSIQACTLAATTYHPSVLEALWTQNVAEWTDPQSTAEYCAHVTPHNITIKAWLGSVQQLMKEPFQESFKTVDRDVHPHNAPSWWKSQASQPSAGPSVPPPSNFLSHFAQQYRCGRWNHTFFSPIEPLFGCLRHPLYACDPVDYIFSKEYLLLESAYSTQVQRHKNPEVFIFDLGASTYTEGGGGASQQWFVERYKERGFLLNGYYGWEVSVRPPHEILAQVPKELLPRYMYYNVPAETGLRDPANPLNMMKAVVKATDFVVVKIDIDNSPVELEFINQILMDPSISSLIDEIFFEHHVNIKPMWRYWNTQSEKQVLKDSYAIFSKLRHLGIRAHGWV